VAVAGERFAGDAASMAALGGYEYAGGIATLACGAAAASGSA
jgi:hypothetical protein